jgi:hypothetical protein
MQPASDQNPSALCRRVIDRLRGTPMNRLGTTASLILTLLAVAGTTTAIGLAAPAHRSASSTTDAGGQWRDHHRWARCGNDHVGGLFAQVPRSWHWSIHRGRLCVWTSPDGSAHLDLRLHAKRPQAERRRLRSEPVDYRQWDIRRTHAFGGNPAIRWAYSATRADVRMRHVVVQAYDVRLEYRARPGDFGDHVGAFHWARRHSGAAG